MSIFLDAPLPVSISTVASFPLFSELPPELRLMIWEAALPGPRIIYLDSRMLDVFTFEIICRTTPPALVSACPESFQVISQHYAKNRYARNFATIESDHGDVHNTEFIPETWFNFDTDTLYLEPYSVRFILPRLHDDVLKKVRKIGILLNDESMENLDVATDFVGFLARLTSQFAMVTSVTIVVERYLPPNGTFDLAFMDPIHLEDAPIQLRLPYSPYYSYFGDMQFRQLDFDLPTFYMQRAGVMYYHPPYPGWEPSGIVPVFDWKIISTSEKKAEYEQYKAAYMASNESYKLVAIGQHKLLLNIVDEATLRGFHSPIKTEIKIRETTHGVVNFRATVAVIMETYRHWVGLKDERVGMTLFHNGEALDPCAYIDETNLGWGDYVNIETQW